MGSYKHFNESMKLMSYRQFMHFLDLNHWVSMAIVSNFFCENSREKLRASYSQIQLPSRMFSPEERFPAGYYASLGNSEIGLATTAAIRALDLPLSDTPLDSNFWAAKQSFDNALNKIIEIVDCVDPKKLIEKGIYSQSTFESTFGLNWCDDKVPTTSLN
ncbi:uncharacterized protein LOC129907166 [Episyrphus balteatus]|uniref:uncharacterized protein LOC129907166 n=1 Tax=Episyrphus balteatus TaxID=286459 RepID=UPI002485251F|nr:uncharacterized protein LOC129907166 [Episyrphus balteatus]